MNQPVETAEETQLIRALGVPSLTANIVNATVGAGIFALPALVAAQIGAAAPLAFLVCALAMVFFVTSFALAGSRVSLTGGMYAYVETAFGRYVGFIAGVLYFLTAILGSSGVVTLLADTVGAMAPIFANRSAHFLIVLLVFGSLAWINVRGVRSGARAVWIVTIVKLVPLLIFVCAGIFFVRRADALAITWPGAPALGRSVLILLFAFVGIEVALIPSGEVKNPARTVPRAIYLALAVTTALYLLIQLVAQGILGDTLGKFPATPLAQAASRFLGEPGRSLMLAGASISAFGFITSDILSSPRILFAFGRDRFLPKAFAHVHPRFHTPDIAIVVYCAICFDPFPLLHFSAASRSVERRRAAALFPQLRCSAAVNATRCAGQWPPVRLSGRVDGAVRRGCDQSLDSGSGDATRTGSYRRRPGGGVHSFPHPTRDHHQDGGLTDRLGILPPYLVAHPTRPPR